MNASDDKIAEFMESINRRSKKSWLEIICGLIGGAILVSLSLIVLIIFPIFWEGFVILKVWKWFVVSHFGLDPISMSTAVGISLLMTLVTSQWIQTDSKQKGAMWSLLGYCYGRPAIILLIGWLVSNHTEWVNHLLASF